MMRGRSYGRGYGRRYGRMSYGQAVKVVKATQVRQEMKDERRKAVLGETKDQERLQIMYVMPYCCGVPEPLWCFIATSSGAATFMPNSKSALSKSISKAATRPGNLPFVMKELDSSRRVWTGKGYKYISGVKDLIPFDEGIPDDLHTMFTKYPEEMLAVVEQSEWCIREVLYAAFGIGYDKGSKFNILSKHEEFGGDKDLANRVITAMACLALVNDKYHQTAHDIFVFTQTGQPQGEDNSITACMRFAKPEEDDSVNAVFHSSYICPTEYGFGFLTNSGIRSGKEFKSSRMRCLEQLSMERESVTGIIMTIIQDNFSPTSFEKAHDMMMRLEWDVWANAMLAAGVSNLDFLLENKLVLRAYDVPQEPRRYDGPAHEENEIAHTMALFPDTLAEALGKKLTPYILQQLRLVHT